MPKRVVTGQRENGISYFARVDELEQDFRGIGSYRIWAVDDLAGLRLPFLGQAVPLASRPSAEQTPEALRTAPPQPRAPGEFRVSLQQMPPREEPYQPYMHWHNTFDLQWLIAGELTILLDGGEQQTLAPGDVVVQHGTNHAWRTGPEGALFATVLYGAERVGVEPPTHDALDTRRWQAPAEAHEAAGAPAGAPQWLGTPVSELLARAPRRIVTGQREDGTSVFVRVEEAEEDARTAAGGRAQGIAVHRLWASNQLLPIRLPFLETADRVGSRETNLRPEALRTSSPHAGVGGLRVSLIKFLGGGQQYGLHWHDTLDLQLLFAGELTIGLDDGSEVTLAPGDAVVQHGTNHSWRTGPDGAVLGLVMLGVERQGVAPPEQARVDQTPTGVVGGVPGA
jgi:quercetin dioxygenase-like cupin family protein